MKSLKRQFPFYTANDADIEQFIQIAEKEIEKQFFLEFWFNVLVNLEKEREQRRVVH